MTNKQPLITFDIDRSKFPHYYDYATAVHKIKEILIEKLGKDFKQFSTEVEIEEIENTLEQLLAQNTGEVELLATVYDNVASTVIKSTNEGKYNVTPTLSNNIFYFPRHHVALVKIPIYQSHEDYEEDFIFAKNDESLLNFLNYMTEKQRVHMLEGIHVLTDSEDGLERTNEQITQQINREDVLLEDHVKKDIFRSIDEFFLKSGTFFKQYDIPYKRGILLYGSPGNGKTTLVKSIAGSVSAPIVYWQITEYTSSYSIHEVFTSVTKMAPMILVIEDIDSMPLESRSVFLNTLDGATSKEGIFLIGTTNYPEKIDPALINRAGRFDRAYEIKQPDDNLRSEYLQKKNFSQFLDAHTLESLAKKTKGLSIAQLNELYMSIALQWHYEKHVDVDKIVNDLQENQKRTMKQNWETDEYAEQLGF
jgi:SpoVK/Ycf46/Vps4 family AAA+-type ATPase